MSNYETTVEGYDPTVKYEWDAGDHNIRLTGCVIQINPAVSGLRLNFVETMKMIGGLAIYKQIEAAAWLQWCEIGRAEVKAQFAEEKE